MAELIGVTRTTLREVLQRLARDAARQIHQLTEQLRAMVQSFVL
ncbi:hypothetical protein [Aeromonas dhakensis]